MKNVRIFLVFAFTLSFFACEKSDTLVSSQSIVSYSESQKQVLADNIAKSTALNELILDIKNMNLLVIEKKVKIKSGVDKESMMKALDNSKSLDESKSIVSNSFIKPDLFLAIASKMEIDTRKLNDEFSLSSFDKGIVDDVMKKVWDNPTTKSAFNSINSLGVSTPSFRISKNCPGDCNQDYNRKMELLHNQLWNTIGVIVGTAIMSGGTTGPAGGIAVLGAVANYYWGANAALDSLGDCNDKCD